MFITPVGFRSVPCPTYPEIRLAIGARRKVEALIEQSRPCAIHIATEGPLGLAARGYCRARSIPFTTAYHTRFPEYIHARFRIPLALTYAYMRWFHGPSAGMMVATQGIEDELRQRGFSRIKRWTRGVDTDLFRPREKDFLPGPRPVMLYVGRVAVEKGIGDFLALDLPGTKYVIGDGPLLGTLRRKYPAVRFAGAKFGEDLARHYAAADVMVFPSRTDTFGLVLLEALASGVPVAAYPVPGPLDVIGDAPVGALDRDLARAVKTALALSPSDCRSFAQRFSWKRSARQFLGNLNPFATEDFFAADCPQSVAAASAQ